MMMVIAIVLGALAGAVAGGESGALAGALLGWLILRSLRQQREIEDLRKRVEAPVAAAARRDAGVGEAAQQADVAGASPAFDARADIAPAPAAATLRPHEASVPMTPLAAAATVPAPDAETVPPTALPTAGAAPKVAASGARAMPPRDVFAPVRRWLFGGNTIVKAGIGILFVGLAFLAKYASEHAHLPIEYRLAAIGAAAVVLLGFGWRLRLSRPEYAQVLQGGAVAVLYLTLFAAFRFYGVIDAMPAFVLMVAVAALAAALAVLQDARALAVIGALGGFATPLIVSTGSDNYVGLFAYYFVLDLGIAAVAWSKTWRPLNLIGFAATFIVATAWGVLKYRPQDYATSQGFLIAFFLLFVVILVLPARRLARAAPAATGALPRRDAWVNSSLLFGLPTVTFALEYGLVRGTPYGAALAALALAGFYVLLATWMRRRAELGITFEATLAIATVFLTLVIPFALDERSTAGAWTLEGAALIWIGFRQQRGLPRLFGYVLLGLAGLAMLLGHERHGVPTLVFNAYLFSGLMAAASSLAGAFFVHRAGRAGALQRGEEACETLLIASATVWLVVTATIEMDAFVPMRLALAVALTAASAVAVLYATLGRRLDWPEIAWTALAHTPIVFVAAAIDAALLANPLEGGGWWAWPIAFAAHGLVLRLAAPFAAKAVAHVTHALGAVTLALVGALLGRAATADWGDFASAWPWLGWLAVPAAMLLLLPRPATARLWPVRMLPDAYRTSAAAVLAAGLWIWTLVANVASDGSAAPLPYLPLLNPLDMGIGIALLATLLWLKHADRIAPWSMTMAAVAGFVWLNAILVRSFHHFGGVPYHFDAWLGSLAVQTGITLLWTAIALVTMWVASTRAAREPWFVGAALLAAVVLKLVLVDLSGSLTRIVSFIGVGVLMLVIAYVAPLPAKEVRHVAT
ncbi:MAG TPA: DUF2339 domain-containing protein [Caldimonas sp.]|nr:DUF2339 domain-containing protein [Caldimonas sp.]